MNKRQRNELGHFFNTTSNVLDTIGSMVENTIVRSVEFQKGGGVLVGGSSESKRELSNKLPPVLFPNRENLSRYAAVFPGYSIDKGNVLTMEPNVGNQLFTLDNLRYSNTLNLLDNPNLPVKENSTQQTLMALLAVVKVTTIHRITVVLLMKRKSKTMTMIFMNKL